MIPRWILSSCALILAAALLGRIFGERISGKLRYAMWLVVLLRLLVPVQLLSYDVPLAPVAAIGEGVQERVIPLTLDHNTVLQQEAAVRITEAGDVFVPTSAKPLDSASQSDELRMRSLSGFLRKVWIMGAAVVAAVFAFANLSFGYRLRKARKLTDIDYELPVYTVKAISSPCLFGVLRPAMYIPEKMLEDRSVLRHALAHEYAHFEQGDHLWGALRCAALSIHWWNPLAWWALVLSKQDGELAADEGALRILRFRQRRAYGETLLALVTARMRPMDVLSCAAAMTAVKNTLRQRIRRMPIGRDIGSDPLLLPCCSWR